MKYLSSFHIFGLLETWKCEPDQFINLFINHKCLFCPATRLSKYGRALSGTVVYIENSIANQVKRIYNDCTFGIFLHCSKTLFNSNRDIILSFVYLPPDNSPFYKTTDEAGIQLLESCLLRPELLNRDANLLIMGDLNARVGTIVRVGRFYKR